MRGCAAVLFLSSAGCLAAPEDETIDRVFDPCAPLVIAAHGDADERASVEAGAQLWIAAAGLSLEMGAADAPGPVVPVRWETAAPFFLGVYDDERGVIVINRRLDGTEARAITVAHELGHAFGLEHVDREERASLMNPENVEIAPTAEDVAWLRSRWESCTE